MNKLNCLNCGQATLYPSMIRKGRLHCNNKCRRERVTSRESVIERFVRNIDKTKSCWLWRGSTANDGRGQFRIDKTMKASRVSFELFRHKIPSKLWVLHKCDNPACVNPKHLFLGTHQDNIDDMVAKGRSTRGERNFSCKLKEHQVLEIRGILKERRERGLMVRLAKIYGVTKSTIRDIREYRSWAYLK